MKCNPLKKNINSESRQLTCVITYTNEMPSTERTWRLARSPFLFPCDGRAPHKCLWDKIDCNKAGCKLCGLVHVCDAMHCRDVTISDDTLICNITGCTLKRVLTCDTWNDRCLGYASCPPQTVECSHDINVKHYIHDILLSESARRCIEHEKNKVMQLFGSRISHAMEVAQGSAIDACEIALGGVPSHIPCDFVEHVRVAVSEECLRFIEPMVKLFFESHLFKCLKQNKRPITCAMLYLMKSGVFFRHRTVLPKLDILKVLLPQECNLKHFFNINPSVITDTENKLKLMVRTGQVFAIS